MLLKASGRGVLGYAGSCALVVACMAACSSGDRDTAREPEKEKAAGLASRPNDVSLPGRLLSVPRPSTPDTRTKIMQGDVELLDLPAALEEALVSAGFSNQYFKLAMRDGRTWLYVRHWEKGDPPEYGELIALPEQITRDLDARLPWGVMLYRHFREDLLMAYGDRVVELLSPSSVLSGINGGGAPSEREPQTPQAWAREGEDVFGPWLLKHVTSNPKLWRAWDNAWHALYLRETPVSEAQIQQFIEIALARDAELDAPQPPRGKPGYGTRLRQSASILWITWICRRQYSASMWWREHPQIGQREKELQNWEARKAAEKPVNPEPSRK